MIKVDEALNTQLNSNSRMGIKRVVELLAPSSEQFSVVELGTSIFDDSSNGKAITPNLLYNFYKYNQFFSWEGGGYDTSNPRKLYRTQNAGESTSDYNSEYATGLVSANVWNDTSTDPFIEFNYRARTERQEYSARGITIEFGTDETIYPQSFDIEITNSTNAVVKSYSIINNTSNLFSDVFSSILGIYNVKVTVHKMNRPNVRLYVSQIRLGYILCFDDEIISIGVSSNTNPISAEAPEKSLSVVIWDNKGMFDPQNDNGIYALVKGNEVVRDYICYGNEKALIGTYALEGKPATKGLQVTFNCKSAFWQKMNANSREFSGGSAESITDIANRCVALTANWYGYFSGLYTGNYNYSYVKGTATELIQKAANVMFAMFIEDRYSHVTVKQWCRENNTLTRLNSADAYPLIQANISGEIKLDTDKVLQTDCNVNYYANGEIAGYVDNIGAHAGAEGGETSDFVIDNDMIVDSDYHAPIAHDLYTFWYAYGNRYKIPYLADPRIEVGDFVSFRDKYGVKHYGIVTSNSFSYPLSTSSDGLTVYTTDKVTS